MAISKSPRKIHLDVRQFAQPSPRRGSIEVHSGYGSPPLNGQEIHAQIQRRKRKEVEGYEPEKRFSHSFVQGPYEFVVSGRADGFVDESCLIEEIKSTFDVDALYDRLKKDPDHPYVWQLRTYGYFYYLSQKMEPELNLYLVSSRNFRSYDLKIELDVPSYELWLAHRLDELEAETKIKEKLFRKRQKEAEELQFPFTQARSGQRELIDCVTAQMENSKPLLIQAPTGLGKTMGVMFPSLKEAMARGQKLVYVTPKNTQHAVAEEAVEKLQEQGAKIRSLTITAKSKVCMKAEALCNPQYCEYARDYYTKVAEHDLVNQLAKKKSLSPEVLTKMAEEFEVCPFELSVEAIERADVIIGDYNYVFSPRSLVGRLAEPLLENHEKPNLVIDEAHNLPARAQDYFSPALSTQELKALEEDLRRIDIYFSAESTRQLERAQALIASYGRSGGARRIDVDPEPFQEIERNLRELTNRYLESDAEIQPRDPILRFLNLWSDFVSALELSGPEFFQTYQQSRGHDIVKITCCDASEQLGLAYQQFKNVVAFSATLKPFEYYQELLGFPQALTEKVEFKSPFKVENRHLMVIPQISTKFAQRKQNASKVADVINRVTRLQSGNYIALFPSFEFMGMVEPHLNLPGVKLLKQEREMKADMVESYLEQMRRGDENILLIGVQGGIFSEGVDFPGKMLIGAFIVGPALPQFDFEKEQVRAYFEERFGKDRAFNYTYVYPAMAKAVQSAGRVIRSEEDRGVIVLMDERFLQGAYAEAMPQGWFLESPRELVSQKILTDIEQFWKLEESGE